MNLFDLHCDTLDECCDKNASLFSNRLGVSLSAGKRHGKWAQVFAVWTPARLQDDEAWEYYRNTAAFFRRELAENSRHISQIHNSAELNAALAEGKCAGILAVENAALLGKNLHRLHQLARDGVKIITLTWNGENQFAHGTELSPETWRRGSMRAPAYRQGGGLKPLGRQLLREISEINIAADVSHLNARSFWDVMEFDVPLLASHSNCRAVYNHPRALSDAQIRALAERGAPIGLTFAYLRRNQGHGPFATQRDWRAIGKNVSHILTAGAGDSVCIGTDYDGTPAPQGLEDTAQLPALRSCLKRHGIDESTLEKLFFKNAYNWFAKTF